MMVTVSKDALVRAMVNKGFGSDDLARYSGVGRTRCEKLSTQGGRSRHNTVYRLAQALGVLPASLIEDGARDPNAAA